LTLASFFVGYRFDPAADCFHFPHERPLDYLTFAGVMFASFWRVAGAGAVAYAGGVALVLLAATGCARHAYLLLTDRAGERGTSVVVLTLGAFSLLFAAGAAAGRVCIGLDEAKSSRYMPYVIPAALALYFQLLSLKGRTRATMLAAFAAGAALMAAPLLGGGRASLEEARRGKEEWKRCYVATENVERCDAAAGFSVYPAGLSDPSFKRKLEHLKRNRLNFYSGD
jgi:hypothetical protein